MTYIKGIYILISKWQCINKYKRKISVGEKCYEGNKVIHLRVIEWWLLVSQSNRGDGKGRQIKTRY